MTVSTQRSQRTEVGKYGATCRRSDGKVCNGKPYRGSTLCRRHLPNPKSRRYADIRAELQMWTTTDELEDPNQVLLRLMSQSFRRAAYYGWLLEQSQEKAGPELEAMLSTVVGTVKKAAGSEGHIFDSEEAVRGLVSLEGQERDRAARFAKLAIDAGIADRIVRLEEAKAAEVVALIRRVLLAAGVDPTSEIVSRAVHRELLALDAGSST